MYQGCAFAGSLCGTYCYAQHNRWITKGRSWGLYGAKRQVREAYRRDYDRIKRPKRGDPKPLKIYMSSSTDPYLPQEKTLRLTRSLLDEMRERPPDVLVVQSHHTLDRARHRPDREPGSAMRAVGLADGGDRHGPRARLPAARQCPPAHRLETLNTFRNRGILTQATVSPLLPLAIPMRSPTSSTRLATGSSSTIT